MIKKINEILAKYKYEIAEVSKSNMHNFPNIEKGIQISRKYLQKLRIVLRNGEFKNKADEIKFFKEQKPFIYGRLKFYTKCNSPHNSDHKLS